MPFTSNPPDTLLILAMFGAMSCGRRHADAVTRMSADFVPAFQSADKAGLTKELADRHDAYRMCRSMFVTGFLDRLKETHPSGVLTRDGKLIGVGLIG